MEGILGMEQPVVFSMDSLFDPTMALLLINAHRDYANLAYRDYQDYKEEEKEFNKLYGDFFSPIDSDNDAFYNATRGKLNDTYNDLVSRGIDPLRSVQGRAALSKALRAIDYTGIAKLQQSAENAKKFMLARDALIAAGKYNKEMDAYFGKLLEGWDTTRDGIFDRMSPMAYQSLSDATQPWFDLMAITNLGMTKDGKMMRGRDPEIAKQIIASNLDEGAYKGTPLEYHLAKIEDSVRSANQDLPEDALKALIRQAQTNSIIDQNKELFTPDTTTEDPAYTRRQEFSMKSALLSQQANLTDRNNARQAARSERAARNAYARLAGLAKAKAAQKKAEENSSAWTAVVDSLHKGIIKRLNTTHGGNININMIQAVKHSYLSKDGNGNVKTDANGKKLVKGGYVNRYNLLTDLQTYIRTNGNDANSTANLKKAGWINSRGDVNTNVITSIAQAEYDLSNKALTRKANQSANIDIKLKAANKFVDMQSEYPRGDYQTVAKAAFAGTIGTNAEGEKIAFQFGDGDALFTPVANLKIAGITYKHTNVNGNRSIFVEFNEWLNKNRISGVANNSAVRVSSPLNGYRYFQGQVQIPLSDFDRFANEIGLDRDKAMKRLGLIGKSKVSSHVTEKGNTYNISNSYVTIPVTRAVHKDPASDKMLNDHLFKLMPKQTDYEYDSLYEED